MRLYFAYGSNLASERLAERVGPVSVLGPARLPGHRLACNKRGRDGSGKANLVAAAGGAVWGVVYRLSPVQLDSLDRFEGGYARIELAVRAGDAEHRVHSYLSARLTDDPRPFAWYKRLMLEGARRHGLPAAWLAHLAALPERPDPAGPPDEEPA